MTDVTPAEDGWRWYSPCLGGCGSRVVTITEYIGRGRCFDCGRAHHNAPVPRRPLPGEFNHLRMGQGGVSRPGRLDPERLQRMDKPLKPQTRGRRKGATS